jgi:hypothetical protein
LIFVNSYKKIISIEKIFPINNNLKDYLYNN